VTIVFDVDEFDDLAGRVERFAEVRD